MIRSILLYILIRVLLQCCSSFIQLSFDTELLDIHKDPYILTCGAFEACKPPFVVRDLSVQSLLCLISDYLRKRATHFTLARSRLCSWHPQTEATLENCVCGDCFQHNASVLSLIAAVNSTHPGQQKLNADKESIQRLKTDLQGLEMALDRINLAADIARAQLKLKKAEDAFDLLCHDTHCSSSSIVAFFRGSPRGCGRKNFLDLLLCNDARGDAGDPNKASPCVRGQCHHCGFDNIIKAPLGRCKALAKLTEFEYSEITRVPKYDSPPVAMKKAPLSTDVAFTEWQKLSRILQTDITFAGEQKKCIGAVIDATKYVHGASCIVAEASKKKRMRAKEASLLATFTHRCITLQQLVSKCGHAMSRTDAQKRGREDLVGVELKPLYPEGILRRGAHLEVKKKGLKDSCSTWRRATTILRSTTKFGGGRRSRRNKWRQS